MRPQPFHAPNRSPCFCYCNKSPLIHCIPLHVVYLAESKSERTCHLSVCTLWGKASPGGSEDGLETNPELPLMKTPVFFDAAPCGHLAPWIEAFREGWSTGQIWQKETCFLSEPCESCSGVGDYPHAFQFSENKQSKKKDKLFPNMSISRPVLSNFPSKSALLNTITVNLYSNQHHSSTYVECRLQDL